MDWQPIETAPNGISANGKLPYSRMMLAIPCDEDGFSIASGMRVGDKFYASLTFYCGGKFDEKQLKLMEKEVNPTHWMPLPEPPSDR